MLRPFELRCGCGVVAASASAAIARGLVGSGPHGRSLPPPAHGRDSTLLPPRGPQSLVPSRQFLDIYQVINKAAIEKERARLSDELNRGYFADIQEFNKHGGKIAMANKTIIPSMAAMKFPDLEVNLSDGRSLRLPNHSLEAENLTSEEAKPSASLLCLSFRANSQVMTESWSAPFMNAFSASGKAQIYEVSFIDSRLLSLGPIKRMMLRILKKSSCPQWQRVYSFGDHYEFRKKLKILNLLSGYIFLLDKYGKIRWQGFGLATKEELSSLYACTSLLLDEK
uniref:Mitochondrial ATPase complex subunit ATP10 n=1 Tax=Anthurium amnicola TaxID=1678845 RepID=A0A1D1Y2U5_9ARAE